MATPRITQYGFHFKKGNVYFDEDADSLALRIAIGNGEANAIRAHNYLKKNAIKNLETEIKTLQKIKPSSQIQKGILKMELKNARADLKELKKDDSGRVLSKIYTRKYIPNERATREYIDTKTGQYLDNFAKAVTSDKGYTVAYTDEKGVYHNLGTKFEEDTEAIKQALALLGKDYDLMVEEQARQTNYVSGQQQLYKAMGDVYLKASHILADEVRSAGRNDNQEFLERIKQINNLPEEVKEMLSLYLNSSDK